MTLNLTTGNGGATAAVKLHKGCNFCEQAKTLSALLKSVLINQNYKELPTLKRDLRKQKQFLLSLMENPEAKNAKHRSVLASASKDGIYFESETKPQVLDSDFIEESVILSDLFNLNELRAAELLQMAEAQKPRYPSWSRGLIAVMLYFDSKLSVVHSLKLITKAISGLTWSADVTDDVSSFLDSYVTDLVNEDLVAKVLQTMKTFDKNEIFEKLRQQKALGDLKHRRMLCEMLSDISVGLSEIISNLFCQKKMSVNDSLKVLEFLKNTTDEKLFEIPDTRINIPHLNLIFSLFHAFDYINEETFIQAMHNQLVANPPFVENQTIVNKSTRLIFSTLYLKWAVSLRKLGMENELPNSCADCRDEDEWLINQAIASEVFNYLELIVSAKEFFADEFRVHRFHLMITDFIVYFPLKIRDLRNHGDEVARTIAAYFNEGITPPADLVNDYENLLKLMTLFYNGQQDQKLCDDFWKVDENYVNSPSKAVSNTQRYLSLNKFCLSACDYVAPFLYAPVIDMISSLSASENAAWSCVEFMFAARQSASHATISFHHFFQTVHAVYSSMREERAAVKNVPTNALQNTTYYSMPNPQKLTNQSISPIEIKGIESMLGLLIKVCEKSERAIQVLVENSELKVVYTLFGLITCKVPISLKAKCMELLSAIASAPKYAPNMWACIEKYQLIELSSNLCQVSNSGIIQELEEFETKQGCYNLSISFVSFINKILKYSPRKYNLQILLSYLIDKLLNHFNTRFYEDAKHVYEVPSVVLDVVKTVVDNFDPAEEISNENLGHDPQTFPVQLVSQLFKDSVLTKKLFFIIEKTTQKLETLQSGEESDIKTMLESCEKSLSVISRALQIQDGFLRLCSEGYKKDVFMSMDSLLQCLNSKAGIHDHLHNILKLVIHTTGASFSEHLKVRLAATEVLMLHAQVSLNQTRSFKYLLSEPVTASMLNQCIVSIIEDHSSDPDSAMHVLEYICSLLDFPKATIGHYLLGLEDGRKQNQVLVASINALHAITYILDNFIAEPGQKMSNEDAKIVCICYKILYKMSVLPDSSSHTLRLLQNIDWFLCRHIVELATLSANQSDPQVISYLTNANSWLIKSFAIDLKNCCALKQQSTVSKMLSAIFDKPSHSKMFHEASKSSSVLNFSIGVSSLMHDVTSSGMEPTGQSKKPWILKSIMDEFDFRSGQQAELQIDWEILESAFIMCEHERKDLKGVTYFDVRKLHKYLFDHVSSLQISQGQKDLLINDIEYVLAFASQENARKDDSLAKMAYLTSWCELFSICLMFAPHELMSEKYLVMQILDFLCASLNVEGISSEFAVLITRLALKILDFFRHGGEGLNNIDSTQIALELQSTASDLLRNLVRFYIYGDSNRKESLCVNTLSAILSFLRLFVSENMEIDGTQELEMARLQNWNVVKTFGEKFSRRLFSDSSLGHVVQKTIALSVFCELVEVDERSEISDLMIREGFIQKMVMEISTDNIAMIESLQKADPFDAIYLMNNAKFCLISKLAQNGKGASALVHSNFIETLGKLTFIDARPVANGNQTGNTNQKSKSLLDVQLAAHRQVLIPLLESCHNILTTLPPSHQDAASLVLQFIVAHFEIFLDILACKDFKSLKKGDLKEIRVACGVISAAAMKGSILLDDEQSHSVVHVQQAMRKLHQQLLKALSLFGNLDKWENALGSVNNLFEKEQMRSSLISIIASLITYVNGHTVSVMNGSTSSEGLSQILFFPSIVAPNAKTVETNKGVNDYSNMGVLLKLCSQIIEEFLVLLEERNDFKALLVKDRYTDEEVAKFSDKDGQQLKDQILPVAYKLLSQEQNINKIKNSLVALLFKKDEQIQALYYAMEAASFVLYRHLDYYFTRFDPEMFVKSNSVNFRHLRQMLSSSNKSPVNISGRMGSSMKTKSGKLSQNNSPAVLENPKSGMGDFSDEKVLQIKSFQMDTLQALPPALIDRILNVDAALNELFSSKNSPEKENQELQSSSFVSAQIRQIDQLLRNYAEKVNKQQQLDIA